MKIIEPSYVIETPIDGAAILAHIEKAGRTCYKSEDAITPESSSLFVAKIIKSGHESVIEHFSITVRIICDRGISHQLVRHRLASFSQESTLSENFGNADELTVIKPVFFEKGSRNYAIWMDEMKCSQSHYLELIKNGCSPGEARTVLPHSIKTEVVMTANLREWRTIFKQRTSKAAHVQMQQIMIPLLKELQEKIPVVFDGIVERERLECLARLYNRRSL